MADVKISALPAAGSALLADEVPVNEAGTTKKVTLTQVRAAVVPIDLSTADASGLLAAARHPALTGDVTNTAGAVATTIANSVVTNAKMANMAAHTVKGNNTAGTAAPLDLTQAQLTAEINAATATLAGAVPTPPNNTTTFLRGDATWAAPAGSGTISSGAAGNNPVYTAATTIGPATPVAAKTTGYTITGIAGDNYLLVDATAAAFNVTLPAATGSGNQYTIKVITAVANAVTVVRAGADTIQGATSFVMSTTQWSVATFTDYASGKWGVGPGTATAFSDLSGVANVTQGGTGANLSGTGQASAVVMQESVGGVFTVRQIKEADVYLTVDPTIAEFKDDFLTNLNGAGSASPYEHMHLVAKAAGGTVTQSDSPTSHPGTLILSTNALATGGFNVASIASFASGSGQLTTEILLKIIQLGTATTDESTVVAGFSNGRNPMTQFSGGLGHAVIGYNPTFSANWFAANADAAQTKTASTTAVTLGWHKLKVVVNAGGTSIQYFVDGTELSNSPISTNLPNVGRVMGAGFEINKTNNVATHTVEGDYVFVKQVGLTR